MTQTPLEIDTSRTALVLVDLQNFTVALPTRPHTGAEVLERAARLAEACRAVGILVILVRVESGAVGLKPLLDQPAQVWDLPPGAHDFPEVLGPKASDVVVTKYNWGGFFGTDLDIQLRRRGIDTLIVGGLVTGIGVDTTVRQAHERGYNQIVLSDGCAGFTAEEHAYCLATIFPRLARLRTTDAALSELSDR
ncbi:MAG: isochorismatase family protein [Brevundimonas sp.]|nr:MAG: isochorismatase family protein [Brevundimonas sp.]